MTSKLPQFTHETHFLEWLDRDFPRFTTEEGMKILIERKDEIISSLRGYFTEEYKRKSENAKYLRGDLDRIFDFYRDKDYKKMAEALEDFKLAIEFM